MNHTALTLIILKLNSLLDTGKYDDITIDEVYQHIDDGTILHFLQDRAGDDIDLSLHMGETAYGDFESFYIKQLQALHDAYRGDERRRWGVTNKGLCLLLAWTNEIVQQGTGWRPNENISER